MAYSDFDLRTAVRRFGLSEDADTDLFGPVPAVEPSARLRDWLGVFARVAFAIDTEKARSEYVVAPILGEAKIRAGAGVQVLPGVALDVDRDRGLAGFCDFVIARSPEMYYLRSPLVAVVEAKRDNVIDGLGRCAAEMVAIQMFNEQDGTPVPAVYGCVTSGSAGKFLKRSRAALQIDASDYSVSDPAKLLGTFAHIIAS